MIHTQTRFLSLWPWPWPSDLDIGTFPRYSERVAAYQTMNFLHQGSEKLRAREHYRQTDTQTDETENITNPHLWVVVISNKQEASHSNQWTLSYRGYWWCWWCSKGQPPTMHLPLCVISPLFIESLLSYKPALASVRWCFRCILEASYELHDVVFFQNLGTILLYAVIVSYYVMSSLHYMIRCRR